MKNVIYQIVNLIDKKRYIGSAYNFRKRKINHLCLLRNNKHYNTHLQNAWDKHGEESFIFEIIHRVDHKRNLYRVENMYIKSYDFDLELYNFLPDASSPLGSKHTEESKRKIGNAHRGKKVSKKTRERMSVAARKRGRTKEAIQKGIDTMIERYGGAHNRKAVKQINKDTHETIAVYESIRLASLATNTSAAHISTVCNQTPRIINGKLYILHTTGGFIWKFADEIEQENER